MLRIKKLAKRLKAMPRIAIHNDIMTIKRHLIGLTRLFQKLENNEIQHKLIQKSSGHIRKEKEYVLKFLTKL